MITCFTAAMKQKKKIIISVLFNKQSYYFLPIFSSTFEGQEGGAIIIRYTWYLFTLHRTMYIYITFIDQTNKITIYEYSPETNTCKN